MKVHRLTPIRVWFAVTLIMMIVAACGTSAAPAAEQAAAAPATEASAPEAPATEEPAAEEPAAEEPAAEEPAVDAVATEAPAAEAAPAEAAPAEAAPRVFAIDPAQSEASYFVEEEFFGQAVSFVTAIGTTSAIEGSLEVSAGNGAVTLGANEFTVDLRTLTSDRPRRDNAIRDRWLESNTYPFAVFRASEVTELPADAALGAPVSFKLNGDMTIREVTQPLTWDVTATLDDSTLSGTATSFLLMRDFGFEPPDIAGMLKVTDGVTLTVNFVAQAAQ